MTTDNNIRIPIGCSIAAIVLIAICIGVVVVILAR